MSKQNTYKNFEDLLQHEAENFAMYPNELAWNKIKQELHEEKSWRALPLIFSTIIAISLFTTLMFYPPKKDYSNIEVKAIKNDKLVISKEANTNQNNSYLVQQLNANHNVANLNINIEKNNFKKANVVSQTQSINYKKLNTVKNNIAVAEHRFVSTANIKLINTNSLLAVIEKEDRNKNVFNNNAKKSVFESQNILLKKTNNSKLQLQFYLTPSTSYRVLEDDKAVENSIATAQSMLPIVGNVNNVVRHKPAFGAEIGVSALYPIVKNLYVKGGLQFNLRKYDMLATKKAGEATIDYVGNNNTIHTVVYKAAYSTTLGNNNVTLDNAIYQLSFPIGLQWNAINGERWGVSASASIQPTVTLNKSIYLISTDYKYYADGSDFFRKWNYNGSAELLLTLKSGKNKWYFGPQIRQQLLPTYNDSYPIKEYRIDYGIKLGFTKTF